MSGRLDDDRRYLQMAARLALRGHGGAEPNPLVGCVIVSRGDEVVGWGYHRRCGGPHAEINALKRAGNRAPHSTVYLTLEPCNHTAQTGPCSEVLIEAGVRRVVYARDDPSQDASGGAERLRAAGVETELITNCPAAIAVSDPFVHRVKTGLPWVIAKWAQTLDGRIATRTGKSRWISNERSRRMVHRERGRVDAILTGIGTVLADDPLLTARHVRLRRLAKRVVINPSLAIPLDARLVTSLDQAPTIMVCDEAVLQSQTSKAAQLRDRGVELLGVPATNGRLELSKALGRLSQRYDVSTILVEAGAGLLGELFQQRLVNEAWVFVAPKLWADEQAYPCLRGLSVDDVTDGIRLTLQDARVRGGDVVLRYRVSGGGD